MKNTEIRVVNEGLDFETDFEGQYYQIAGEELLGSIPVYYIDNYGKDNERISMGCISNYLIKNSTILESK
ncbi:MAG: hypothetical protein FE834_06945 [Gammaproteobacteria bacterium]|nr:hypothetical protein [Gammaproteobacteria bacterium]